MWSFHGWDPSSKFCSNLIFSFCVILLTNRPTNQKHNLLGEANNTTWLWRVCVALVTERWSGDVSLSDGSTSLQAYLTTKHPRHIVVYTASVPASALPHDFTQFLSRSWSRTKLFPDNFVFPCHISWNEWRGSIVVWWLKLYDMFNFCTSADQWRLTASACILCIKFRVCHHGEHLDNCFLWT